ncbi:MAG: hypothetical protein EBW14_20075, partial [Oxalobacteraceae bacterium]|nr:hypothetical protein [Oxalobacteraceae bacterium]
MAIMREIVKVIFVSWVTFFWSGHAMAIEEPPFRVLQSEPPFEHRLYTGFVVAETDVVGDFDAASRSG